MPTVWAGYVFELARRPSVPSYQARREHWAGARVPDHPSRLCSLTLEPSREVRILVECDAQLSAIMARQAVARSWYLPTCITDRRGWTKRRPWANGTFRSTSRLAR